MNTELEKRYKKASHAVQTGVALEIELGGEQGAAATPKYLRVGVNSAMSDHGALARLLIKKGVITQDEYELVVVEAMEAEAEFYEKRLEARYNRKITLL